MPTSGTDEQVAVLIVDDQAPFREAARSVVGRTPGFAVAGDAASGEEAVDRVAALRPDLVLLDVVLPGMDGITTCRTLLAGHPDLVVVLVSTYRADDLPDTTRGSGAVAYVDKEDLTPDRLRAVWAAARP